MHQINFVKAIDIRSTVCYNIIVRGKPMAIRRQGQKGEPNGRNDRFSVQKDFGNGFNDFKKVGNS